MDKACELILCVASLHGNAQASAEVVLCLVTLKTTVNQCSIIREAKRECSRNRNTKHDDFLGTSLPTVFCPQFCFVLSQVVGTVPSSSVSMYAMHLSVFTLYSILYS